MVMHFPSVEERRVPGAGGVNIFVREGGNAGGPPILFVHGFLFSSDVFARQFEGPLAEHFRLVAIDVRGHGRSDKPTEESAYTDPEILAEDVASVVTALGLDRPVVVGWSMGSRVALNYGWYHGFDRIAALNLVSASVLWAPTGEETPPTLRDLQSDDEAKRDRATREFIVMCSAGGSVDPELLAAFTETAMTVPVGARRGIRKWPFPYADALPDLETPLLVTHGGSDPLLPESISSELASLTRAGRLSVIGGGHLPFLQDVTTFDRDLAAFAWSVFGVAYGNDG